VRDFTTAETQGDLALVTFFQEAAQIAQLDLVVALVRTGRNFTSLTSMTFCFCLAS
jgi:hypothetical protein